MEESDSKERAGALCNEGAELLKQKLYEVAIIKFDKALEYDPSLADAWHNKGLAYRESKKYDEALKAFDKALEINHELYRSMISKGDTLFMQGFLLEATDMFFMLSSKGVAAEKIEKRVEKIKNEEGIEEAIRGRLFFNDGDMEKAIEEFDISLKKNPNDRLVWIYKSKALRHLKRYDETLSCLNEVIGRFSFPEAYREKAFTCYEQNNFEEAYLAVEAYLEHNPYDESALNIHKNCQSALMNRATTDQLGSGKTKKSALSKEEQFRENVMKIFCILTMLIFIYLWATKSQRLVTELNKTESDTKKNQAIYELSGQKDDEAFNGLIKALGDKSPGVRASAVHALSVMKDKRAIDPLIGMLEDPSRDVRYIVCDAFGKFKDQKTVGPLMKALRNDNAYPVRMLAAQTLGLMGATNAVQVLYEAGLNDREIPVRLSAIKSLDLIGDKSAIDALKAMEDKVNNKGLSDRIKEILLKHGVK